MNFRPYRYPVQSPRAETMAAPAPAAAEAKPEKTVGFPTSVSATAPLGEAAAPTQTIQRDTFLFHPYECSLQRILVSSTQDVDALVLVQLVQMQDGETVFLSEEVEITPRQRPESIRDTRAWEDGPVFLRVKSKYSAAQLLVTLELLTEPVL